MLPFSRLLAAVCRCSALLLPWLLLGCSADTGRQPLPTGHYEGTITYQGSPLRMVLNLREAVPGQLQADVSFPEQQNTGFPAFNLRYNAPKLDFEQSPGGIVGNIKVEAIREGDFWRGEFTADSLRGELLLVRRGQPEARPYKLETTTGKQPVLRFISLDTTMQHPAIALFPDQLNAATALTWADALARQGFSVTLVIPEAGNTPIGPEPDTARLPLMRQVLKTLRQEARVDTSRIGIWAAGSQGYAAAVLAASHRQVAFLIAQSVGLSTATDAQPFRTVARQRVPVLGLYGNQDTLLNARESSRRLRNALGGRRGSQVRTFAQADHRLMQRGKISEEGKWEWPGLATGSVEEVLRWLGQVAPADTVAAAR
ncbi:dienelactone hydrolase family protein [Hymenobacter translucens]|uniref:dienelactone hydrolase family protein n=1 Tax=Hymenobacter translucens TaxID=2886507 RepID=UPI001D0E35A5|nr:hypothetical protein [Hymenobacter translucens]